MTVAVLASYLEGLVAYNGLHDAAYSDVGPVSFQSSVVPPLGPGGDVFFDDNAWVGLAAMEHHRLSSDPGALQLASRLLEFTFSGWTTDPSFATPGGIRWKATKSNRSRNTCSNAPVCELAALVHLRTGDERALEWSVRIYQWIRRSLLGPDDLYFDRVDPAGTVERTVWSYNQGTMIGAGVLLLRATGDGGYLQDALATARSAMERFDVNALLDQEPAFNAVFFRNLLMLDEFTPTPEPARRHIDQLAASYADAVWESRRIRSSGLSRSGLFDRKGPALNDAAAVIEIYALLAGAPPHA